MKDNEKVELTAGDLRRAADKCGTAKEVLKTLCPEVFKNDWEDVTSRVYFWADKGMTFPCFRVDGIEQKDAYITDLANYSNAKWVFKLECGRIWRRKSE